jgi:hypothetical protein
MKTISNIANVLPKHVFWDMDSNKLSSKKDKDIIIPRAVLATTKETFIKDITLLEDTYTAIEIYNTLKNTKERISNNVCRMVSERYNMPEFLRYKF